jgi:hypothetical protein
MCSYLGWHINRKAKETSEKQDQRNLKPGRDSRHSDEVKPGTRQAGREKKTKEKVRFYREG